VFPKAVCPEAVRQNVSRSFETRAVRDPGCCPRCHVLHPLLTHGKTKADLVVTALQQGPSRADEEG